MKKLKSISDLKPAEYNPRKISGSGASGLRESIKSFGDISGIVWNSRTGNLVSGHQRVEQLRKLGGEMKGNAIVVGEDVYRVRVVDWPIEKEKAANVTANNPSIQGGFTDGLDDLLIEINDYYDDSNLFGDLLLDNLVPSGELDVDTGATLPSGARGVSDDYSFSLIIDCDDELQQSELLEELEKRGLKCRLLMS